MFKWLATFLNSENRLEPKERFHIKIEKYYSDLAGNTIPAELLKELVDKIADTQYQTYQRFWKQYPKSRKRYSELKMADLEHPSTHYEITGFFKSKDPLNCKNFSKLLMKMDDEEFKEYEVRKHQYETK